MFDRRSAALLVLALAAVIGLSAPGFSSAAYTTTTSSSATVSAAADWTPPTVTMVAPASPAIDTVTLAASASDGETGVRDVTIEQRLVGATTWTTVCTTATSPYSCAWNTAAVADGTYDLRARAVDRAGYAATSTSVRTTVANTAAVVLASPGSFVRNAVQLSASVQNSGGLTYTVQVQYSVAGANSWKTLCSNLSSPYTCSWATTADANGAYDLRAVATSGGSTFTSAVVANVTVDNLGPTVTVTDPGTPLRGTKTFAATASDAHSGVDQVTIQYALTGSSTWQTLCTRTATPYSCSVDTSTLPDGTYGFRAVARDRAGNTTTSSVVANRVVDNSVYTVSMVDPGTVLSGTVTLSADTTSTGPITSVRIQYATTGGSTWTDVCTDTTSPYSCAWDTTKVADGAYDFRAILTPATGAPTTSAVLTGSRVDNDPLRGVDIQATNGGTIGKLDSGDQLTYTWSSQLNLASVASGWTGSSQAVTVTVTSDTLTVSGASGGPVNLGSVNLNQVYVKNGKTVTFAATMTAGTTTVGGVARTTVTVVLGNLSSGGGGLLETVAQSAEMVWTPSAAVTDLNGGACSTAAVTETGALDRDF
ncbi:Ig-like domain-containing protein [Knoellia sp. LjRoot47]|uniref:Ig-like domain-containing protein n=1 Tax=Knoellia sp. LjRoot47 TaxID=3342330 RepID=UPI003ECE1CDE